MPALRSGGFLDLIRQIVPHQTCSVFTNGNDGGFLTTNFHKTATDHDLHLILYAGSIGEGQELHRIIPSVTATLAGQARFRIIDNGGRLVQLNHTLTRAETTNVELCQPVPRNALLNEFAATGKPIVAGVSGCAAEFLRNEVPNAKIFDPCDVQGMVRAVTQVMNTPEFVDRSAFCMAFDRATIMDSMAADILSTPRSNTRNG